MRYLGSAVEKAGMGEGAIRDSSVVRRFISQYQSISTTTTNIGIAKPTSRYAR